MRAATGGAGVAHVLEIGGKDTLPKALASLGLGGHVALIGGLTGFGGAMEVDALTSRMGSMTSIYVGSREDFETMNAFLAQHKLKPIIDRVFAFEEAPAAFEYLESGAHFRQGCHPSVIQRRMSALSPAAWRGRAVKT